MFRLGVCRHLLPNFHVDKFAAKDYQAMCSLIKEKYPVFNEAIELHKDIRLLDENNKLVGIYGASQARRKATTLKKDIVLVNLHSTPAVCKIINFRESILQKFYEEIVTKRNEQLLRKASSTKQLKIPLNLNEKEFQIKEKQLLELAKKNFNVRVFMRCKPAQTEDALSRMEALKSSIQNKCIIEKDVRFEETQDEEGKVESEEKFTYSMVIKSRENEFIALLNESKEKEPEIAIQAFLKRYYRQEDVEMRDLQANANLEMDTFAPEPAKQETAKPITQAKPAQAEGSTVKTMYEAKDYSEEELQEIEREFSYEHREAKARLLNERLRRILASTL